MLFSRFSDARFAARSGVFLEQAFFNGFVVFALDFFHVLGGGVSLEILEGGLDGLFDFLVFGGALRGLASSFLRGFDDWH